MVECAEGGMVDVCGGAPTHICGRIRTCRLAEPKWREVRAVRSVCTVQRATCRGPCKRAWWQAVPVASGPGCAYCWDLGEHGFVGFCGPANLLLGMFGSSIRWL